MKLLGISGSLRAASFNTKLLHVAASIARNEGATFSTFDIGRIPHYNGDLDDDQPPSDVQDLKQAWSDADGVILASPEYNYGIPGVLKNGIDWASRPAFESVMAGKPTAVISASMATTGGARMQAHLKNVLAGTLSPVYDSPEFLLASAHDAFTEDGTLKDEKTQAFFEKFIGGFLGWVREHIDR